MANGLAVKLIFSGVLAILTVVGWGINSGVRNISAHVEIRKEILVGDEKVVEKVEKVREKVEKVQETVNVTKAELRSLSRYIRRKL